jgi:flagellar operon protein
MAFEGGETVHRIGGIGRCPDPVQKPGHGVPPTKAAEGFKDVLAEVAQADGLKFSKHALERISSRGMSLDRASMERLNNAVEVAGSKGANESLVLMDELALIVSVKNKTVITAMPSTETRGNVFTAIDSAIVA